jgi:hypothetical protein
LTKVCKTCSRRCCSSGKFETIWEDLAKNFTDFFNFSTSKTLRHPTESSQIFFLVSICYRIPFSLSAILTLLPKIPRRKRRSNSSFFPPFPSALERKNFAYHKIENEMEIFSFLLLRWLEFSVSFFPPLLLFLIIHLSQHNFETFLLLPFLVKKIKLISVAGVSSGGCLSCSVFVKRVDFSCYCVWRKNEKNLFLKSEGKKYSFFVLEMLFITFRFIYCAMDKTRAGRCRWRSGTKWNRRRKAEKEVEDEPANLIESARLLFLFYRKTRRSIVIFLHFRSLTYVLFLNSWPWYIVLRFKLTNDFFL